MNNVNGIFFNSKIPPKNGEYTFSVNERYLLEDREINIPMEISVPETAVKFIENHNMYQLYVDENVFSPQKEKEEKLKCEIFIYPKFN